MTTVDLPRFRDVLRQRIGSRFGSLIPFPGLSKLQGKLIVPYVLLTLVLAAVGIYVVTRLVTSTIRERFVNQIYEAARVASDAVVRQERVQLENLRLMVFSQGVAEAIAEKDIDELESVLLPLALNSGIEAVTVVDAGGLELLTLGLDPGTGEYLRTSGRDFSDKALVKNVLQGVSDNRGDKYIDYLETNFGQVLFTSSAVNDAQGELVGAILVGTRLESLITSTKLQALADLIVLDGEYNLLATTLPPPEGGYGELESVSRRSSQAGGASTIDLHLFLRDYQAIFIPFEARGETLGWMGVVLPSSYVVAAEATSRNTFSMIFTLGTVGVIIIGLLLSQSIARPILRLHTMTHEVAAGNLDQSIGLNRSDEIGELADAFDVMTLRLRERTQEASHLYEEAIQRNKELAEINQQLRSTQMQLVQSEKLAAVGQLTAGIVHDVKNPLTVVKGMTELLIADESTPDALAEELKLIRDSVSKANVILSDLLTFARQSKPEMEHRDMRETVEAALRLTAFPLRKAHIELYKELPEESVMMTYDNQQIEQVLVNLVNNAIHAMPAGGKLYVRLAESNGMFSLDIQDTGIGIPTENLGKIFDPFFTTKPEGEGTGLGLSVSYGIISNHDGRIEVNSTQGEGTTFTVLLPYR